MFQSLVLTAHVKSYGKDGYIAWLGNEKFKGIVVHEDTPDKVLQELLLSVKVKISYDYNIPLDGMELKVFKSKEELTQWETNMENSECKGEQTINLALNAAI